jgi:hypothetical protein
MNAAFALLVGLQSCTHPHRREYKHNDHQQEFKRSDKRSERGLGRGISPEIQP